MKKEEHRSSECTFFFILSGRRTLTILFFSPSLALFEYASSSGTPSPFGRPTSFILPSSLNQVLCVTKAESPLTDRYYIQTKFLSLSFSTLYLFTSHLADSFTLPCTKKHCKQPRTNVKVLLGPILVKKFEITSFPSRLEKDSLNSLLSSIELRLWIKYEDFWLRFLAAKCILTCFSRNSKSSSYFFVKIE